MINQLVEEIVKVCCSSKNKNEVRKYLFDLFKEYSIKKTSENINTDILVRLQTFLVSKKMEGLSEKTLENYRKIIHDFGVHLNKPVHQITSEDIRIWLSRKRIKISTVRYCISVIRSFYDYLLNEEIVNIDPTRKIKLPKLEQRIPKALSIDELEVLREGCKTLREKALLEIFYATGCRISEIQRLNKTDINWLERSLLVLGKGNKERIVFIGSRAAHALKKYLDSRNDSEKALFITERGIPKRLSSRSIHLIFKKIANRVSIHKNVHPHVFRHTMATAMLNHGARLEDVQALLGHSSPNTTQVYARVSAERKKQAYKQHFVN